jgi:3-methylcrotonyl-CoA carboxylase alpha subunit
LKRFVNGVEFEIPESDSVEIERLPDRIIVKTAEGAHSALAVRADDAVLVSYKGRQFKVERSAPVSRSARSAHSGEIHAPMPGLIVEVAVRAGESVTRGQKLVVLESMKTQQAFSAPFDGTVEQLSARDKTQVKEGDLLLVVKPRTESP